jgi:low affinity Fe/Cu permease
MSTAAQIQANQQNAQLSTGPNTDTGRAASARNRLSHGLSGQTAVLPGEDAAEFQSLLDSLMDEYQAATPTELILVQKMAQHYWMAQRAVLLQNQLLAAGEANLDAKRFGLFLRYQTTHDRAFHKSLSDLLKLRKEARKQEIGFESQKQKEAAEARKQELHEARLRAVNAKAELAELETEIKGTIEAPLPGNTAVPYETMRSVFRTAATEIHRQLNEKAAAA